MNSNLHRFLYCSDIIFFKISFLYPIVIEIFSIFSSSSLSIILKITGFPFSGINPDGIFPKIFSNSVSILPALKMSTLRSFESKFYTSNFSMSFGVPSGINSSAISISNLPPDSNNIL